MILAEGEKIKLIMFIYVVDTFYASFIFQRHNIIMKQKVTSSEKIHSFRSPVLRV